MKHKMLCLFLALVTGLSLAAPAIADSSAEPPQEDVVVPPAQDGVFSGTLGRNLTWVMWDDGVLTISGTGPMADQGVYEHELPPDTMALAVREIVIEEGVTSIGANAFNDRYLLEKVTLPESLESIGVHAFANDYSLTELTIPDGVTVIGDTAFQGCTGLETLHLPTGLKRIGDSAFANTGSLSGAVLTEGLESIGYGAFSQSGISSVTIPSSLKVIEQYSFSFSGVHELVISEGVESVGERAFMNCGRLQKVTIPDSVTSMGYGVFSDSGVESAVIGRGVDRVSAMLFSECASLTDVTFLGSVERIENNAFDGCLKLAKITLPAGVRTIEDEAFKNCIALTELSLPAGLESIGRSAFYRCIVLPALDLPRGLKTIDQNAFENCEKLARLSLPASIESIGQSAFANCYELTEAVYAGTEAQWKGVSVETGNACLWDALGFTTAVAGVTDYGVTWSVADGVLTLAGDGWLGLDASWAGYADTVKSIVIGEGFTDITRDCFAGFSEVTDITLPMSLARVDQGAFRDCKRLASVTYPGGQADWNRITVDTGNEPLLKACPFLYHGAGTVEGFDWDFTNGVFTVTGSGVLKNTVHNQIPYQSLIAEQVTKIVFGEGITEIDGVPCGFNSLILREICIPKSLTYVAWQVWDHLDAWQGPTVTYAGTREEFFNIVFREGNEQFILCYDPTVSFDVNDYTVERTWTEATLGKDDTLYNEETLRVVSADGHVLLPDVDYTLYHSGCYEPGTASVEIIGRHCYGGIQTLHYTVLPGSAEWRDEGGKRYYYVDDRPVTGLYTIAGALYLFDDSGALLTGWQEYQGCRYYFGDEGAVTGWQEIEGKRYCFDENGALLTGYQWVEGEQLFFDPETGEYRESMPWTLSDDGTLTISGTGPIEEPYGWSGQDLRVVHLVIEEGVTGIGESAFHGFFSLEDVSIPESVRSIGESAFASCTALAAVDYGGTDEQWDAIENGENNGCLTDAMARMRNTPADAAALLAADSPLEAARLLRLLVGLGGT